MPIKKTEIGNQQSKIGESQLKIGNRNITNSR
jgi:hypothetical protein